MARPVRVGVAGPVAVREAGAPPTSPPSSASDTGAGEAVAVAGAAVEVAASTAIRTSAPGRLRLASRRSVTPAEGTVAATRLPWLRAVPANGRRSRQSSRSSCVHSSPRHHRRRPRDRPHPQAGQRATSSTLTSRRHRTHPRPSRSGHPPASRLPRRPLRPPHAAPADAAPAPDAEAKPKRASTRKPAAAKAAPADAAPAPADIAAAPDAPEAKPKRASTRKPAAAKAAPADAAPAPDAEAKPKRASTRKPAASDPA